MKTIILILALATTLQAQTHKDAFFFNNWIFCQYVEQEYKVPFEVVMAIAIQESGWGTSYAYKYCNNPLGLRRNGKPMRFNDKKACFDYFGKLLTTAYRYRNLKDCTHFRYYCIELSDSGYNTNVTYAGKLIRIILDNDLDQFNYRKYLQD